MVVCPRCGNNLLTRQVIVITNRTKITCTRCSSKLQVKNKNVSSIIGGVGGGVGAFLGVFHLEAWVVTDNLVYLWAFALLLALIFTVALLLMEKYVQMKVVGEPEFEERRFCRYCGAQNQLSTAFCQRCGKKMD